MKLDTGLNRLKNCAGHTRLWLAVFSAMIVPCAWSSSIDLVYEDLTVSSQVNLSDVYLVEGYSPSFGFANQPTVYSLGSVSANTPRTFSNVPDNLYFGTSIFGGETVNYFTIIGVYNVPNGLVKIGFKDSVASLLTEFGNPFGVAVPGGFGFSGTEATLATALENSDTATIGSVLTTLIAARYPGAGIEAAPIVISSSGVTGSMTLDSFSDASLDGTANFAPAIATPEPSLSILLGAGGMLLVLKRKRIMDHHRP